MTNVRYRAVSFDGFTIVLDLIQDDYLAIPQETAPGRGRHEEVADAVGTIADDIRFNDQHVIPRACMDLDNFDHASREKPRLRDWLWLVASIPIALWKLRSGRPVGWFPNEGARHPEAHVASIIAARRFRSMRPFVPGLARCLPHSLLLRSYLDLCGHPSMLVVGVRIFPFDAHSWVQAGKVVLTDDLERTAAYFPIAAG